MSYGIPIWWCCDADYPNHSDTCPNSPTCTGEKRTPQGMSDMCDYIQRPDMVRWDNPPEGTLGVVHGNAFNKYADANEDLIQQLHAELEAAKKVVKCARVILFGKDKNGYFDLHAALADYDAHTKQKEGE